MKIYIAGPYSGPTEFDRENNTLAALRVGIEVMRRGHQPFVPHLFHFLDREAIRRGQYFTWRQWMTQCKTWLRQCEGLLYLSASPGANEELALARELGLPVFFSLAELPDLARELPEEDRS